ncbi:MAG: hypothetical protein CMA63_02480 [Euryarchaeota archaeon]|nr:hypothetical protein [Euryarchaeota archaeon]
MSANREKAFGELYEKIQSAIFAERDYERATKLITLMADQLREHETADVWWIGEHTEFTLAELVVGAFWHFTEWHGGQHSLEYRALSSLSLIFNPGMATGPEEGGELYAFESLADLAKQEVAA